MSDIAWIPELLIPEPRESDHEAAVAAFEPRAFRDAVGSFATGVVAITYESDGVNYGMTVNSFTSVSLEPALILVSVMRSSKALPFILGRRFAVNVLADDQLDVAMHFAGRPEAGSPIWLEDGHAPRLQGAVATLQCAPWAAYDGGDHVLLVGRVLDLIDAGGEPLVFSRGKWAQLSRPPAAVEVA